MDPVLIENNKTCLLNMRARLIPTVQNIEEDIIEDVRAQGDISNAPTHLATEDDEGVHRNVALAQNEEKLLEQVEEALARIEAGNYGCCVNCRKEISRERLEALPHTPYCINCAETFDAIGGVEP